MEGCYILRLIDWWSVNSDVPYIGFYIQAPFTEYLEKQKLKLHRSPGQGAVPVSYSCTFWH